MPKKQYPFIFIESFNEKIPFTSPQAGRGNFSNPPRTRAQHGRNLTNKLNAIWKSFSDKKKEREAAALSSRDGHYLEFKSSAGFELVTKSLENIQKGIRLLTVREIFENEVSIILATVYIPFGKEGYFIEKVTQYIDKETNSGNPKNQKLVNSINDVKAAILESFWQDNILSIPNENPEWCEIWLRSSSELNDSTSFDEFKAICQKINIEIQEGKINFPERCVVLVKASRKDLEELIASTDLLAEIRKGREAVDFWINLSNLEQVEWVEELSARIKFEEETHTSICILDTGINNGHPLIAPFLRDQDKYSYDPDWGVNDDNGHGTWMSGIATFGNLSECLQSGETINIRHKLESGKILPPRGENDPQLYGFITQQVISLAEIGNPGLKRIICMAITENEIDRGKPSSWSGAIDNLSSGAEDEKQRLIFLAAGNVTSDLKTYPEINQVTSVHSPGQSWNALTIGAFTELARIEDDNLKDYKALAPPGGLSPFSTTSMTWEKKWPIKPEVLFEGGNIAINEDGFTTESDELSLLTTHSEPRVAHFESFSMTSAATAKAAWMAAQIQAYYPEIWPETIRCIIVHSADWTQIMKDQFYTGSTKKLRFQNLVRTCGYGVPNLEKALYCTNNSLTLVSEEEIQPFDRKEGASGFRTKEMHFYEIPWPKDVLLELGETKVKMKVTLSYFIEPGPGEIGWKDRYRYRSHGLKFDVNTSTETQDQFVKRINKASREQNETLDSRNDSGRWAIGSQNRNLGSLHSDFIEGTAAEIATCNYLGIYPVIGWWRERSHLNKWDKKTRYSLVISVETPEMEIDLYTPVAVKLKIPIETEI